MNHASRRFCYGCCKEIYREVELKAYFLYIDTCMCKECFDNYPQLYVDLFFENKTVRNQKELCKDGQSVIQ